MKEKNALQIAGEVISHHGDASAADASLTDRENIALVIGRHQALGAMAGMVTASWAQTLKQLRDSQAHKLFDLERDRFCAVHLNMSRQTADRIIADQEEFGPTYFNLNQIVRVSRDRFRMIAGRVTADGALDIGGEVVAITKQNADRIREYLETVEAQHQRDRDELTRTKQTLTKTKEERDNAKKAAERNREQLDEIRRKEESLFADATELQRKLLKAQQHIQDAVFLITAVTSNELDEPDQAMVDGLVEFTLAAVGRAAGRDFATLPPAFGDPRDLISEYSDAQKQKGPAVVKSTPRNK